MESPDSQASRNLILAALPQREMQIFRDQGQKVFLHEGKTLQGAGLRAEWVFFPTTALISLMAVTLDGLSVEACLVGHEGMVGLPQFFGSQTQPLQCLVQHAGEVCQMPAHIVRESHLSSLQTQLLRYAGYRMTELAQSAVCNRFHVVRQRFCRWLLTAQDRTGKQEMEFTQEALSAMVGARRPVVTSLMGMMEDEGLIDYRRSNISVLDRRGLERSACECYHILSDALNQYVDSLTSPID